MLRNGPHLILWDAQDVMTFTRKIKTAVLVHIRNVTACLHTCLSVPMSRAVNILLVVLDLSHRKVAQHEAETAGTIMAFFLSLGLALGAALSFGVRAMI